MSPPFDDDALLALTGEAFDDIVSPPIALVTGAKALRVTTQQPTQLFRLDRVLAPAAAGGLRVLSGSYPSHDGALVTEVHEDAEGHLIVGVHCEGPAPELVSLSWSLVQEDVVGATSVLVTPLAPGRVGSVVEYDLGTVETAVAVDVRPAEPFEIELLMPDDVSAAFNLIQRGSARRAWQLLAERSDLDPGIVAMLPRVRSR